MCSEYSRESARGSHPSRPRRPRGCRGAERPTLVSSETASTKEQPASSGTKASPEQPRESARGSQPSRTPSGVRKRSAPCPCRRKQRSQKDNLHRREPKPRQNSPGRAREGRNPLAPRPRGDVGERSAHARAVGNQSPQKNSLLRRKSISPSEQPRESSRGCEPSRLPIEAGDLRGGKVACPKGKQVASRPTKRNRRFRLVAPGR